jgi:membrane protein YqaA with SNARE-associated domain
VAHSLLSAFLIIFGVNLLPAFGPPTWSLLVFFRLNWHLNPVALVAVGVLASGSGRYLLALGARRCRRLFPAKYLERLKSAEALLGEHRRSSLAILLVFIVSPLPSAQLFVAAGLLELPLLPLTVGFVIGRIVTYSIYVGLATLAEKSFGSVFSSFFGSPWSIALQLVLLVLVVLLPLVDWGKVLHRHAKDA